ncbi:MAG: fumarylacetoacetate hydrolase family protein [Gammaproteobacteria bacterium]|nr:fumarylacetoacetate hydrolase family protein [Gammaproteobacteria bacterium]NIR84909.1 fumarylacetoacetate hydrolase family protein [Gammaproteobacteria bacterium]NIR91758.1 fumarylacetoacetate hydrolase family protein [Gammaproteobacteria bacterium]NIU05956.1 fumarylacetoacetate hydrolase family protein [Gammaproteobacteria bacterium]NIV53003.1 2-hydroxyhepta-2,4-diene-1,7-dioate isomerase [Gammaproteobacteria bacterium]
MRLVTIRTQAGTCAARVDGERAVELPFADVGALIGSGEDWPRRAAASGGRTHVLGEVELAPVVIRPRKIICLGLNYKTHITEMGRELPAYPTLFAKFDRSLIGARDPIRLPRAAEQVDWEVELAFVIGRSVRHVGAAEAEVAIAGYTILNDISARDFQWRTPQWLQGKTFEGTTPVGPALVTPEEVGGARDLRVRCEVDGVLMQDARTSDFLFKPADLVAYVSRIITLDPGDLISTGTPGGVGAARHPKVFLEAGQVVRTSIEGLGELVNECVAEA